VISAKNISISYQDKTVINDLSFDADKGEKICLFGPSGGGKTTILNALMGFADIKSGKISIKNMELNHDNIDSIRKNISWLPQNINLPVNSGMELIDLLNSDDTEIISEYLEKFGLSKNILEKNINEISGGQKQRMVLSICLSLGRKIILLDEPTSALDDESIKKIIEVVFGLKDITVISTSHNPKWIENCDKKIKIR
jgi:putative ABC transport system ATP-binding protein